jgi:hypothetical protein
MLTNGVVGALSGLTLSRVGKTPDFPRQVMNMPNIQQQPEANEEIPTFVH